MMEISHWENDKMLFDHLASHLLNGRIALILGAGISKSFGLPDWNDLVKKMYEQKKLTPPKSKKVGLEKQAEQFKVNVCKNDDIIFKNSVQEALYIESKLDFKNLKSLNTLSSIAALIMASKRGNASNVITFNFDNVLELYLSYYGFVSNSRYKDKHWTLNADVNIYHPHGYIPAPPIKEFSKDIIFDQESYSKIIGDESNVWRQHVLSILRTHFCIFIGLSGDDSNFDSFLVRARDSHAAIDDGHLFWGLAFLLKDRSKDKANHWTRRGIFPRELSSYKNDTLATDLLKICQTAAKLRTYS